MKWSNHNDILYHFWLHMCVSDAFISFLCDPPPQRCPLSLEMAISLIASYLWNSRISSCFAFVFFCCRRRAFRLFYVSLVTPMFDGRFYSELTFVNLRSYFYEKRRRRRTYSPLNDEKGNFFCFHLAHITSYVYIQNVGMRLSKIFKGSRSSFYLQF